MRFTTNKKGSSRTRIERSVKSRIFCRKQGKDNWSLLRLGKTNQLSSSTRLGGGQKAEEGEGKKQERRSGSEARKQHEAKAGKPSQREAKRREGAKQGKRSKAKGKRETGRSEKQAKRDEGEGKAPRREAEAKQESKKNRAGKPSRMEAKQREGGKAEQG